MNTSTYITSEHFRLSCIAVYISCALMSPNVSYSSELDMSFIQGGHSVDKEAWSALNDGMVPGQYLVDVIINGNRAGKQILNITPQDGNDICFTSEWLSKSNIYINQDFFKNGYDKKRQCYVISKADSTKVEFDVSTQTLTLGIPQSGISERPENVEWDYGTSAFRMNYNINGNASRNYSSAFGSAALKANAGNWVINSNSTIASGKSGNDFSVDMFTASRAIQNLEADLSVGKVQSGDNVLGSTGTYGISLIRNNNMKPGNLGYSPVFTGIANGPSRVTLSQEGRILYSEVVPAGPFSVKDVSLYTSGDVKMTITGDDGREHIQYFPVSVMAGQLNPGQHEFKIDSGIPDDNSKLEGGVLSAAYGYGINSMTFRTGIVVNQDYYGQSIGLITGLGKLGAVSAEGAWSVAKYRHQPQRRGRKAQFSWSKRIEETGTGLRVSWSRTQNDKFTTLSQFDPKELWEKDSKRRKVKDEWNVGVSQPVKGFFSLSLSGWQRDYHDRVGKDAGISGSVSTRIGDVSLNLGATGSKNSKGANDWAVSASVSVPFTAFDRRYSSSSSVTTSKGQGVGISTGLSGSLSERFSYSISSGRDSDGSGTSGITMSYSGDKAMIGASLNQSSNNGTSGSVSMSGSVLAVPEARSVMLSKTTSDTIAVVNIKDTPGVKVTSGSGDTDKNGNLVVPLSSYDWNSVTIEAGSLPLDTELATTSKKIVPADQAVVWMPFESVKVKRYLLQVKHKDGNFVQGGTWARDKKNTPLGFVANNGVLMINTVGTLEDITVGKCKIPASKMKDTEKLQEIICD
ncbi:PefC/AfrB family outer membrane usher protein [Klebsiella pneumoniae]|nr:outer membrane usher protein PefC [Escherichia coli]EIX9792516.1 PefC/AfrB family outer membrane usher protein [Klebsiella pneumoniae]HBC8790754.1 PefC/AfrB family outer membrane usher protein [Citrobacter braakii]MCN2810876.1 PefC/AfrB family outer membrane usher protein [Escherichia coli]HAX2580224.1 PefC/AfrB family outer membrane usher protein [Escherichia coli]